MRRALLLVVLLAGSAAPPAIADTITLRDGRKLTGKVEREEGDRIHLILRHGKMAIPRADVVSIEKGPIPEEIYRDRSAAVADDDLEGLLELARWCKEQDLDRESRWEYRRILDLDPDHEEARDALGFVRHEEGWITRAEHREITRYPWVRLMRERLGKTKVDLDLSRAELVAVLADLAKQTEETFRFLSAPKLRKSRLTYKCQQRPVTDVLDDLARHIKGFDYVFTESGVVITSPEEARKLRRQFGMPQGARGMTTKQVQEALRVRHLTLLFIKKPFPWVIRYLETIGGLGIVVDAPAPGEPLSYQCTSKPLGEVLDEILTPIGLTYRIVGASIMITQAHP